MAKKIESLTPEQEALLPEIRDEWIALGLSTDPANRPEAEEAINTSYKVAGLEVPQWIIWMDSPFAGALAQAVLPDIIVGLPDFSSQSTETISELTAKVVQECIATPPDKPLPISKDAKSRLTLWYSAFVGSQFWADMYAGHEAMAKIGVTGLEPVLDGQCKVARNAGWWWAYMHFAVVTERPNLLVRDPAGRLHSSEGPAIRWPDGWGVYAWHGRRVPPWVVENPTVEQIRAETNVEIRRCAIESLGWDTFINSGELRLMDTAPDPGNPGQELRLFDVPSSLLSTSSRLLICINGSPERDGSRNMYSLPVPSESTDAVEAAAALAGLSKVQYLKLKRRT